MMITPSTDGSKKTLQSLTTVTWLGLSLKEVDRLNQETLIFCILFRFYQRTINIRSTSPNPDSAIELNPEIKKFSRDQGSRFITKLKSGIQILDKNVGSVGKKYTSL